MQNDKTRNWKIFVAPTQHRSKHPHCALCMVSTSKYLSPHCYTSVRIFRLYNNWVHSLHHVTTITRDQDIDITWQTVACRRSEVSAPKETNLICRVRAKDWRDRWIMNGMKFFLSSQHESIFDHPVSSISILNSSNQIFWYILRV
jgi:hypothetical protein